MNVTVLYAALGVLILAVPAFFIAGRRTGTAAEQQRQAQAKATAEEISKRIISEAEREGENLRKSAVVAGKEALIKLRESFAQEIRGRRSAVEKEEKQHGEGEHTTDR